MVSWFCGVHTASATVSTASRKAKAETTCSRRYTATSIGCRDGSSTTSLALRHRTSWLASRTCSRTPGLSAISFTAGIIRRALWRVCSLTTSRQIPALMCITRALQSPATARCSLSGSPSVTCLSLGRSCLYMYFSLSGTGSNKGSSKLHDGVFFAISVS